MLLYIHSFGKRARCEEVKRISPADEWTKLRLIGWNNVAFCAFTYWRLIGNPHASWNRDFASDIASRNIEGLECTYWMCTRIACEHTAFMIINPQCGVLINVRHGLWFTITLAIGLSLLISNVWFVILIIVYVLIYYFSINIIALGKFRNFKCEVKKFFQKYVIEELSERKDVCRS